MLTPFQGSLTSEEIRDGAVQLTKLLRVGEYTDPIGRKHKVAGDMTKVRFLQRSVTRSFKAHRSSGPHKSARGGHA